jgi:hypothetical protein
MDGLVVNKFKGWRLCQPTKLGGNINGI